MDILHSTKKALHELRSDESFEEYVKRVFDIAVNLEVPTNFPAASAIRSRIKKRLFQYECVDETPKDPKIIFKIDFYFKALDQATSSISERFEQLKEHNSIFEFLYDIHKITSFTNEKLSSCCKILQTALTDLDGNSDVDSSDLACELKIISGMIPEQYSALEVLQLIYTKHLNNAFPETVTAIKILLTLPVTVASGERSFSKLKLIKNYLRTTMT